MLDFSFSQQTIPQSRVLDLTFAQERTLNSNGVDYSFTQQRRFSGSVDWAFSHISGSLKKHFQGKHAIDLDDFDVRVTIDGQLVPMCDFADTMTIKHGENEAYVCNFVLLKREKRKNPQPIYPEKWYTQNIVVEAVSGSLSVRLYQGWVDKMGVNVLTGRFEIQCTDRREQQMNALPESFVKSIGFTSVSAHGNTFETQFDEINKRLETTPSSLEFDAHGTPYLTPWREKDVADIHITPCMIYQREPNIELAAVGGVLNEVSYTVRLTNTRLLQRSLNYYYQSGLSVCTYPRYLRLASVDEINQAVEQTGWHLGNFHFTRLEPSGWYNCGGRVKTGWIRDAVEETLDENGKVVSRSRSKSREVRYGQFELLRRWTQETSETYTITLRHLGSIARYRLGKEKLNFDVSASTEIKDWNDGFAPHKDGLQMDISHLYFASKISVNTTPSYVNARFEQAPNGDWYAQADLNDDAYATLRVAYWTAYTKMLASHRQNTVDFQLKFLAGIDLRHTHHIEHSHFSGRCKVAAFEHRFDFRRKLAQTRVQYRFFRCPDGGELSQEPPLSRLTWQYPRYEKNHVLSRVELNKGQEVLNQQGMIYRLATINAYGRALYSPVAFRINTPDIEKESTDAVEQSSAQTHEVGIYNTPVEIRA